ncbi:MAG TPA: 30S ribosomal protein S20 [Candidatus Baltobacteraceae bacterium]
MPNIKAAVKWVRQSEKRTKRNLDVKSRLKTLYKKAAHTQDAELTTSVESQFDKAAQKGIIHPNKAARKKSRLAKAVKTSAAAPVKSARSGKKKTSKPAAKKKTGK